MASRQGFLYGAKNNDNNVGFVYASVSFNFPFKVIKQVGILNDFYIIPEYRRKGIGKELIAKCIRRMRECGVDVVRTRVLSGNKPAIAFYKSLGFQTRNFGMTLNII